MDNRKRICLITGATSGIGKAAATILAEQGYEMILVGRNPTKVQDIAKQMRAHWQSVGSLPGGGF